VVWKFLEKVQILERYSTPSIEVRQIKRVFILIWDFYTRCIVTLFFLLKNDIILDLYIDGIECINDLLIDVSLLMPQETISIKFKFIKQNVVYRIDQNWRSICAFQIPNLLQSTWKSAFHSLVLFYCLFRINLHSSYFFHFTFK
jgi:hypothetical protein